MRAGPGAGEGQVRGNMDEDADDDMGIPLAGPESVVQERTSRTRADREGEHVK